MTTLEEPIDRIRQELMFRLRWNISGPLDDIAIADGVDKNGTERSLPFASHPVADESLAEPPISRLHVSSIDVQEAIGFYTAPDDYRYQLLLIENADGRPISLKQFVTEVHIHLNEHKPLILDYRKPFLTNALGNSLELADRGMVSSQGTRGEPELLFKNASASGSGDDMYVNVSTFVVGEFGKNAKAYWDGQRATMAAIQGIRNTVTTGGPHQS